MTYICSDYVLQRESTHSSVHREETTLGYQKIWFLIFPAWHNHLTSLSFLICKMSKLLPSKNFLVLIFLSCDSGHIPFVLNLKLGMNYHIFTSQPSWRCLMENTTENQYFYSLYSKMEYSLKMWINLTVL